MCETKISKELQIDGNYPFSQQYFHTQAKNIFQPLKYFLKNEDILFLRFLNYLKLGENTYILSLIIKLTKSCIFLKKTLKNIKTNAFNTRVVHLWFANTNIQFIFNPYTIATYYTSCMTKIDKSITS
jgi:hypothetical protein